MLIKKRDEWELMQVTGAAHLAIMDQLDRIEEKVERLEKNSNVKMLAEVQGMSNIQENEMKNAVEVLKNSFENWKESLIDLDIILENAGVLRSDAELIAEEEKKEIEEELKWMKAQLVSLATKIGVFLDGEVDELELRIDAEAARDLHRCVAEWIKKEEIRLQEYYGDYLLDQWDVNKMRERY